MTEKYSRFLRRGSPHSFG